MAKTPEIIQNVDGKKVRLEACYPPLEKAFPDVDLSPMQGTFEDRFLALTELIDDEIGEGNSGHTSPSTILKWSKIYGTDVVQTMISFGRLEF